MCPSIESFLRNQNVLRIRDYLTEEVEEPQTGFEAMRFLKLHRPEAYNEVLCLLYDITCHKTGESCFAETAPAEELDKFFIGVPADGEFAQDLPRAALQLYDSYEAGLSAAVAVFGLEAIFYGEPTPA